MMRTRRRALMIIAIVAVLLVIGVLVIAARKPDKINIERTAEIKAAPEQIFPFIADFHHWPSWAPQDKTDSTTKRTFAGNASGKGAISEWNSSGQAGAGRMEITEATPFSKVTVKVDFTRPFVAHNTNEFTLEPLGEMTRLKWSMLGTNPFMAKVMSVFLNMDRFMGKHFEDGLASIKKLCESSQ